MKGDLKKMKSLKKKIVIAEAVSWMAALVAINSGNWCGFFWCFLLMAAGYFAFVAVDITAEKEKREAKKAKRNRDRVFQTWLKM